MSDVSERVSRFLIAHQHN